MFNDGVLTALLFALGAIFGSFANVIIVRLPKNESIVRPRSRCVQCLQPVAAYDNIPIFSWLILRGKCRNCGVRISFRYPLVELLMGALFAGAGFQLGLGWLLFEYLILLFGLVTISFIDFDHYIIPDVFSLGGIVVGLVGALVNPERQFLPAFFGMLLGGGFLWLIAYIYFLIRKEEGMGGGDIKLLAWIGAVLEWKSIPFTIFVSSIIGSIIGLLLATRRKSGMKTMLPFGPFIAIAAVIYALGGKSLATAYLRLFFPWIE